jgi:hypothetical protein
MPCRRCGGFAVVEPLWDGTERARDLWVLKSGCVNCGWIEYPVIRANRRRPLLSTGRSPRHGPHAGTLGRHDSDESCGDGRTEGSVTVVPSPEALLSAQPFLL